MPPLSTPELGAVGGVEELGRAGGAVAVDRIQIEVRVAGVRRESRNRRAPEPRRGVEGHVVVEELAHEGDASGVRVVVGVVDVQQGIDDELQGPGRELVGGIHQSASSTERSERRRDRGSRQGEGRQEEHAAEAVSAVVAVVVSDGAVRVPGLLLGARGGQGRDEQCGRQRRDAASVVLLPRLTARARVVSHDVSPHRVATRVSRFTQWFTLQGRSAARAQCRAGYRRAGRVPARRAHNGGGVPHVRAARGVSACQSCRRADEIDATIPDGPTGRRGGAQGISSTSRG